MECGGYDVKCLILTHCWKYILPVILCVSFTLLGCPEWSQGWQLNKSSVCVRSETMCSHLGGVMTCPWMVRRLQTLCTELVFGLLKMQFDNWDWNWAWTECRKYMMVGLWDMAEQRFDSTRVHVGSSPLCVVGLCAWLKGDISLSCKLHFLFGICFWPVRHREQIAFMHFPELTKQRKRDVTQVS